MHLAKLGANPRVCDRNGVSGFYWACKVLCSGPAKESVAHYNSLWASFIENYPELASDEKIGDAFASGGTALHAAAPLLPRGEHERRKQDLKPQWNHGI